MGALENPVGFWGSLMAVEWGDLFNQSAGQGLLFSGVAENTSL
jgi:hypothetical protein